MVSAIIDPTKTHGETAGVRTRGAQRPRSLDGLRVGLIENTKRNAAEMLDRLGDELGHEESVSFVRRTKTPFALPISDELMADLDDTCDVVILGVGDCGSCSAAAIADGVALEARGVPSAVVITDAFVTVAKAMAALQGYPDYPFIVTSHPVANLSSAQLADRAKEIASAVAGRLTDQRVPEPAR